MLFDNIFSILVYVFRQKKIPRLLTPKTLTDKILYLKLRPKHIQSKLRKLVSDRIKVRDYVSNHSSECELIPLLWTGKSLGIAEWDALPNKFVIKANHGSKMVMIVDKEINDFHELSKITQSWLKLDYYKKGKEWVYKDLDKVLVVEEFIDFNGDAPPDYKFFCLNGKVRFIQVDLDRYSGHSRNLYSKEFELLDVKYHFDKGYDIESPILLDRAIKIAEELSSELDFVRVDLYILDNTIYFGELTNFPGNCLESFTPNQFDLDMGDLLELKSGK
ncbi:ATP-grasp fold amidoligase family protein [Psychromonas sp. PT13]|uniref:ATP-grasp fold amidoligase family protein n=1 Tax=Psychromonas sp. PT13 TaxID=3439547 RepID=UPI003EB75C94